MPNTVPDNRASKKVTAHIISHNHWDREWIFTAKYANRWLPPFFENLFKRLEEYPEYRFVLDGQTLMIEDYLEQLSRDEASAAKRAIRKYAGEGRLLVGPAYLQPDWGLVSGEALVRNLLIGGKMAKQYGSGNVMKVGWMLDNFGQIAQAPQIYRGFGIEGAFVWRGVELPPDDLKSEFWWESPDGSKILSVYLADSYRNAMVLSLTKEIALERIYKHTNDLLPLASTPNVVLMNGYEQVPWPDDVFPIIEEFNEKRGETIHCKQSTPPEYLEKIREANPELPTVRGYLYSGKYMPILKGVFSSRSRLKSQNNEAQRELERWAEPFATLSWAFGSVYSRRKFERIWKTLLVNHTHDDVCGCNIDTIARDMHERFNDVIRSSRDITEISLRTIAQTIDTGKFPGAIPVVVFNPSSRTRGHVFGISIDLSENFREFSIKNGRGESVAFQHSWQDDDRADIYIFANDVPSLGYKTYYIFPEKPETVPHRRVHISEKKCTMENDYLKVQINPNGTLNVQNKETGDHFEHLAMFENGGDAGDTYDYSYPESDEIVTSRDETANIRLVHDGDCLACFSVSLTLQLPESLTKDRQSRSPQKRDFPIEMFVEMAAASRRVELHIHLKNTIKDHRLRLMFPSNIQTDESYAEEPFDVAKFPLSDPSTDQHIPEKMSRLMLAGRYTAPVNTRIFHNFAGLSDGKKGLTVISGKLSEYEILEKNQTIAVTLMRSVGWLARYDLQTRVGDVGPHIFTPEAQEIGDHYFSCAIYPNTGNFKMDKPHFKADNHNMKFRAVRTGVHDGGLPDEFSLLNWVNEDVPGALRLTALKRSEDGDCVIVRFYNTLNEPVNAGLQINLPVAAAHLANLNEDEISPVTPENGVVSVSAKPKEIITLRLVLELNQIANQRLSNDTIPLGGLELHPDLPDVAFPPVLTPQEIGEERDRYYQIQNELRDLRNEAYKKEDEIDRSGKQELEKMAELQRVKAQITTLTRKLYEARISTLLNQQLLDTIKMENELEEIGEELCWARTKKRVYEYLSNYYEKRLSEEKK